MVQSECCVSFDSWCEWRSRVVKAPGTPRGAGVAETNVPGDREREKQK
jgi:hypothetical protein